MRHSMDGVVRSEPRQRRGFALVEVLTAGFVLALAVLGLSATLANGSRCIYLSTRDAFGKGIYQETASVLAQGTLETLTEAIAAEIRKMGIQRDAAGSK